jgi:hypothetical protein
LSVSVRANNQLEFTFPGEDGITYFLESSADLQNWAPIATNSNPAVTRVVTVAVPGGANFYRLATSHSPRREAGLKLLQGLSFKGNHITVDAYDSSDTNRFPNGMWNSTNAFAGGNVATAAGLLRLGNAKIHGRLLLSPGANYNLGTQGLVGDTPSNWPAQSGMEGPEWACTNFFFQLPDVVSPFSSGLRPFPGSGTNSFVLFNGLYYVSGDFSASQNLQVNGAATLYVTGNFSVNSITISEGSILKIYVGKPDGSAVGATLGDGRNAGYPYSLQFFGLPSCTTLTLSGGNGFTGTIYAPEAVCNVHSSGNTPFDFQGSCIANSLVVRGDCNFHFDRNLYR